MDQSTQHKEKSFFKRITYTEGIYPTIKIGVIQNPNRLYAIPLVGILIKVLLLIPVAIVMLFLSLWAVIAILLINPFVVLITGKYWRPAYSINVWLMKLSAKIIFYIYGLTDKYPGFNMNINDNYTIEIPYPENPSKLYAIPILGILIRSIFLIPYFIFANIIDTASAIGTFFLAWAVVLFKGKYPEGLFELSRDSIRLSLSSWAYMSGLSDRYPSFYISMAHDKIKIILIAVVIILNSFNIVSDDDFSTSQEVKNIKQEINF